MTKKNDKLSKAELKLMAELLEETANELADWGEADRVLPASLENKELLRNLITTICEEEDQEELLLEIEEEKDELLTTDSLLLYYFAQRCHKLANKR